MPEVVLEFARILVIYAVVALALMGLLWALGELLDHFAGRILH